MAGTDGGLPEGFVQWQRGVTCTVRPELLRPLVPGREYRINVTFRRKRTRVADDFTAYGELYERVRAIANARVREVAARNGASLHTWILAHAWFRTDLGPYTLLSASITLGVMEPGEDGRRPTGQPIPSRDALLQPSGQTLESWAALHTTESGARRVDEIYTEFDDGEPSSGGDVTISYGEYVANAALMDFSPYLQRAERLAAFYGESLANSLPVDVMMREWTCLETNKATDPLIVTVHLFLRLRTSVVYTGAPA